MIGEITKQLKPLINGKLIYLSQYGSHLYGLNTENSDLDFRGVYIPNLDDIILKKDKDEINEELEIGIEPTVLTFNDGTQALRVRQVKVDVKIFSLQKFIQLCSKADTNALDLLFSTEEQLPYFHKQIEQYYNCYTEENEELINYIRRNRNKLINTDRMQSPCEYALKQSTKYGKKIERFNSIKNVLEKAKLVMAQDFGKLYVQDLIYKIPDIIDNKHVKLVELDNHGKLETYLFVAGVNHMLNLPLEQFIQRLENKLKEEYFSERTTKAINSKDEVDWKAMSHALRISLEIKELLNTGNITFPLKDRQMLLDIKQGKADKTEVAEKISNILEEILNDVNNDELGWKYDEEFWNDFILKEVKNGKK